MARRFLVARLAVIPVTVLVALLSAAPAMAQTTALYIDSQPGDPIGRGLKQTWTPSSVTFTASARNSGFSQITVNAQTADISTYWTLNFGTALPASGIYEHAVRSQWGNVFVSPLLDVYGSGVGCNTTAGRFQIYEIVLGPNGSVTSFAADFEQHCDGTTPALFGAIRYNSSRSSLVPFNGAYPVYSLHLDGAVNGYVTGPGIDCGAGRSDCDESYEPNTLLALHATPSPGYVFLGWAGDCRGDQDAAVMMTRRRFCMPVFNAAPGSGGVESPDLSDAALVLDGVPGVADAPAGRRVKQVFAAISASSPIHSAVTPVQVSANQLQFQVNGPDATWILTFGAPAGATLATGSYSYALSGPGGGGQLPLLSVSQPLGSVSCSGGGRFTIHELSVSLGVVTSFAADFELPCYGGTAPLTGSLRYRSTRANLLPFDGAYPLYALHIAPTLGGFVTASGISCGDGGRTDCDEVYGAPALVSLQATASAGYQFVVWSGSCSDQNATTAVSVDSAERCMAVFAPQPAGASPGDPSLANGSLLIDTLGTTAPPSRTIWFGDEATVSISGSQPSSVTLSFLSAKAYYTWLSVSFSVPTGRLQPGDYEDAYSDTGGTNVGLSVTGCYSSIGRFRVYEATFDTGGRLLTFAADFEALCGYSSPSHVVGAVRFNSTRTRIVPFDGVYPLARLTIDPTVNGIVTSAGIDCGPGRTDCTETYGAPGSVALQATPLPGYRFVGWSGACDGPSMTTLLVDWPKQCSAIFNAVIPGMGIEDPRLRQGSFMIDSQPGDRIGRGRRHVWLDAVISISTGGYIFINVRTPDDRSSWGIYLRGPNNQQLRTGSYEKAGSAFTSGPAPGLYVASSDGSCGTGRFVVHEISFNPNATAEITALAVDFEVQCSPGVTSLVGSIRFHSTRSIVTPFAPTTFTAVPLPSRPDFNRDGSADLIWRHTVSGHNAIWFMNGVNVGSTTFFLPVGAEQLADLTWEIRATADMNRDGFPDVIWQNSATGSIAVWFFRSATRVSTDYLYNAGGGSVEPDLNWKIVAAADMDRDGQTDLVWRNRATGALRIWHMNGVTQADSVPIATVADLNWEIAGVGDMNGDGMPDLVWRYATTGGLASWFMYDAVIQSTVWLSPSEMADTRWHIVGVADMNGDGKTDLVWQNFTTGELGVWFMNGIVQTGGQYLNPSSVSDPRWRIVGVR